jgi:DNA-binding PadR family transcriptional regulator
MAANKPQQASATVSDVGDRAADDARSSGLWLVLALVIEQPSHGYEISRRYQARFGSLIPTSVPRIYGALDRLREMGMIEPARVRPVKPGGKQHRMRRSYRATEAGVAAYRRWVAERMRDDPQRLELLGRIASAGLLGIDAVLEVIDRFQRQCVEELRALPRSPVRVGARHSSLEELTEALVVDQQRRELAAHNDWAVHARKALEAHRERTAQESQRPEGAGAREEMQ